MSSDSTQRHFRVTVERLFTVTLYYRPVLSSCTVTQSCHAMLSLSRVRVYCSATVLCSLPSQEGGGWAVLCHGAATWAVSLHGAHRCHDTCRGILSDDPPFSPPSMSWWHADAVDTGDTSANHPRTRTIVYRAIPPPHVMVAQGT